MSSLLEASKHGNGTAVKHNMSYMPYYVDGSNLPGICRHHSLRFVQAISHHKIHPQMQSESGLRVVEDMNVNS